MEENDKKMLFREYRTHCMFCRMIKYKENLLYFNEEIFIFKDRNDFSAKEHILICPIVHIQDISYLLAEDFDLLKKMNEIGEKFLLDLYPDGVFRKGFHGPPINSIDHLHLHYFVLPFKINYYDKTKYGTQLTSLESVFEMLKNK